MAVDQYGYIEVPDGPSHKATVMQDRPYALCVVPLQKSIIPLLVLVKIGKGVSELIKTNATGAENGEGAAQLIDYAIDHAVRLSEFMYANEADGLRMFSLLEGPGPGAAMPSWCRYPPS